MSLPSTNNAVIDIGEIFIIAGTRRITGFATGQFFSASKNTDDYSHVEGADGESVSVRIPSSSYNAQLTLLQSSRSNDYLWGLRKLQLNTPGNAPFPFAIEHRGTTLVTARARITRPPDVTFGDGVESRVWSFRFDSFEGTLLGLTTDGQTLDIASLE